MAVIFSALALFFIYVILSSIFTGSRFKVLAITMALIAFVAGTLSQILQIELLSIIGFILDTLAFVVGFYGLQTKIPSEVPLVIFISSFLVLQLLGYVLDINFLKSSIKSGTTTNHPFSSIAIPILLFAISAYVYKQKKREE